MVQLLLLLDLHARGVHGGASVKLKMLHAEMVFPLLSASSALPGRKMPLVGARSISDVAC